MYLLSISFFTCFFLNLLLLASSLCTFVSSAKSCHFTLFYFNNIDKTIIIGK